MCHLDRCSLGVSSGTDAFLTPQRWDRGYEIEPCVLITSVNKTTPAEPKPTLVLLEQPEEVSERVCDRRF